MSTPSPTPGNIDWIALSRELKSIAEAGLRYLHLAWQHAAQPELPTSFD